MRRILIIDDDDDIREVAALSLEATADWSILTASSGKEGIKIAAAQKPDAILMDVMMPEMDGPTTFKQLQLNLTLQEYRLCCLQPRCRESISAASLAWVLRLSSSNRSIL